MRSLGARASLVQGVVVLLLIVGLGAGCASEQERYEEHRSNAEEYLREGKTREALIELRSALKLRPTDADVNFRIADVLNSRGDYAEAAFFYGEARRLDPAHPEAGLSEAMMLRFEEPERSRELLDDLAEREPSNPLVWVGRAHLALAEADADAALVAARTAVELGPENAEAHSTLGVVHQARVREARLTRDRRAIEDLEAALAAFERAHELRELPGRWRETAHRAQTLASWPDRADEAGAVYREAVDEARETDDESRLRAALLQTRDYARGAGDLALRKWALEQLIELNPDDLTLWVDLARAEEAGGGSAEAVLLGLVESRPADTRPHLVWSSYLFEEDRVEDALAYLETQASEGEAPAPPLLEQKARMEFRIRDVDAARETVRRLQREHPQAPETGMAAAQLAIAEDRPADAVAQLKKLRDVRSDPDVLLLLADAQLRLGNAGAALSSVDEALDLAGGYRSDLERLRLRIRLANDDCQGAIQSAVRIRSRGEDLPPLRRIETAECFYEAGQEKRGRAILEPVLRKGANLRAIYAFARHEGVRQPDRARQLLEAARAQVPNDPTIQELLASLDLRTGETDRAVTRLDEAIAASEEPSARLLLARSRALAERGDDEEALRDALAAYEADPDLQGPLLLASVLERRLGRSSETVARLEEARGRGELGVYRQELLARLLLDRGDQEGARRELEELLRMAPDNVRAKNDLAYLLADSGQDMERALRLAEEAMESAGQAPLIEDTLGYVYLKRGLLEPALRHFEHAGLVAKRMGVERPVIAYHRGLTLARMGRTEEARRAFEEALALDEDFAEARQALEGLGAGGSS